MVGSHWNTVLHVPVPYKVKFVGKVKHYYVLKKLTPPWNRVHESKTKTLHIL
jgi:hypothetical protein